MNKPIGAAEAAGKTHVLQSKPDTVHWGFSTAACRRC